MRRSPWWGCPPIAEGWKKRPGVGYLRVRKGSIIICRPAEGRGRMIHGGFGAHAWTGSRGYEGRQVENGTYATYLGRKGMIIKILLDGLVFLSNARRWGLVDPPKKLTRFSRRGVPLS